MKLCFESVDEVRNFVKNELKGAKRGGKDDGEEGTTGAAPTPLQPPAGGGPAFNPAGFAHPAGGAGPGVGAFPAAGVPAVPDPQVLGLVQRINARIDWCLQPAPQGGGQAPDAILSWFRGQCGAEAANYTLDQIRQSALPRMSVPSLENIAKLMAA